MPTTATFRAAHSLCRVFRSGISRRHGAHQVAQKLITNDLPLQALIEVALPSRSWSENSGRRSGILAGGEMGASKPGRKSLAVGALASPAGTAIPRSCRRAAARLE